MTAILGSPAKIMLSMSIYIAQDHGCARPRVCKTTGVQDDRRNDPDSRDDGPGPDSSQTATRTGIANDVKSARVVTL